MKDVPRRIDDLNHDDTLKLIVDFFHRIVLHYGLWYAEVRHQMGEARSLQALKTASARSAGIQAKRLAETLGIEMEDGLPVALRRMSTEELRALLKAVSVNWLANDGVWFQAVEFASGMNNAKRCNDSCWAHFSPLEAWSIRQYLGLGERPGLEGLKRALGFRLYAAINVQSIVDEGPDAFMFQMNKCRVQAARKRKGLDDYPCKSAGLVEYAEFARAIDERIVTECVGCPPDPHPEEWFCAWRFSLPEA
ncbi:MAG TPA: cytosolic protein [Desulfobacteraceae bacterium]|nr:cytosolic protein [Deltaproteobacteria bacterium]RLB94514.1 MAG: cytosolic protein [Deltaproteobacteria bacterium]HDI59644.1 cytosolic protein [Desulfobacteraceae bacterium]